MHFNLHFILASQLLLDVEQLQAFLQDPIEMLCHGILDEDVLGNICPVAIEHKILDYLLSRRYAKLMTVF